MLLLGSRATEFMALAHAAGDNLWEGVRLAGTRWDAGWYQIILASGPGRDVRASFYPGFPLLAEVFYQPLQLMRHLRDRGAPAPHYGNWVLAASLVLAANVSLLVALWALWRLYQPILGTEAAVFGLGFLLTFPSSFFLSGGYSESSFIASSALAFLFAHRGRWLLAGAAGAAACLIALPGALIALPLLLLWSRSPRRGSFGLLAGAVVLGAGALAYPVYTWLAFADPLLYFHVATAGGLHGLSNPLGVLWNVLRHGGRALLRLLGREMQVALKDVYVWLAGAYATVATLASGLLGLTGLPLAHVLWILLILVASLATGPPSGLGRYVLAAWPMFFLWGWWLRRRPTLALGLMVLSCLGLGLLADLHGAGLLVA
jgi:hypothetical protein